MKLANEKELVSHLIMAVKETLKMEDSQSLTKDSQVPHGTYKEKRSSKVFLLISFFNDLIYKSWVRLAKLFSLSLRFSVCYPFEDVFVNKCANLSVVDPLFPN